MFKFCQVKRIAITNISNVVPVFFLSYFLISIYFFGTMNDVWNRALDKWAIIYYVKFIAEVVASTYALFYLFVAVSYKHPNNETLNSEISIQGKTSIAYLCCDDFDQKALESILENTYKYNIEVFVHDDSSTEKTRLFVNDLIYMLREKYAVPITILRRDNRVGGKPGALNNLLNQVNPDTAYILLCDSDSYFFDPLMLPKAIAYFEEPTLAVLQFKTIGVANNLDAIGYRILSESITFYDSFVYFMDKFGWSPFLGHNALLRFSAIKRCGGFTLGEFADDIDFSVKARLNGYSIKYARDITAGERHPETYEALRSRTTKWTFGCTQILRKWSLPIILSNNISFYEKLTFFFTVSYYHFQILLLAYLSIFYIFLPFKDSNMGGTLNLFLSASLILFITFLPSISYFMKSNSLLRWPYVTIYWGLTYGSQDFVMVKGLCKCLFGKTISWVPTNKSLPNNHYLHYFPELLFALVIVVVAIIRYPLLLLLPTTFLFVGKYMLSPFFNKFIFSRKNLG